MAARWGSGGTTELAMSHSELDGACDRPSWDAIGTSTTLRLETSDGQVSADIPVRYYFDRGYVEFNVNLEPTDVDEFAEVSGIRGTEFAAGDEQAWVWIHSVISNFGETNALDGAFEVVAFGDDDYARRDYLEWCLPSGCRPMTARAWVTSAGNGSAGMGGEGGAGGTLSGDAGGAR